MILKRKERSSDDCHHGEAPRAAKRPRSHDDRQEAMRQYNICCDEIQALLNEINTYYDQFTKFFEKIHNMEKMCGISGSEQRSDAASLPTKYITIEEERTDTTAEVRLRHYTFPSFRYEYINWELVFAYLRRNRGSIQSEQQQQIDIAANHFLKTSAAAEPTDAAKKRVFDLLLDQRMALKNKIAGLMVQVRFFEKRRVEFERAMQNNNGGSRPRPRALQ